MAQGSIKIIVFDLDETLGSFSELGALWDSISFIYKKSLPKKDFFRLLDMFPNFLRPNIVYILGALCSARASGNCFSIIMYTNNQGPLEWARMISDYFDYKLNCKVFDFIIPAYKVGRRIVEPNRTSHNKNYKDLLRCTNLPETTLVCFIDDQYHTLSCHPNVMYIPLDPYTHKPNVLETATKFHNIMNPSVPLGIFIQQLNEQLGKTWKSSGSNADEVLENQKRLVYGLRKFLNNKLMYSPKKKKRRSLNNTRKKRKN